MRNLIPAVSEKGKVLNIPTVDFQNEKRNLLTAVNHFVYPDAVELVEQVLESRCNRILLRF